MDLTNQETLDMFATHALAAYIINDVPHPQEAACSAYEYAQAMMAERSKRNENGVPLSEVGIG